MWDFTGSYLQQHPHTTSEGVSIIHRKECSQSLNLYTFPALQWLGVSKEIVSLLSSKPLKGCKSHERLGGLELEVSLLGGSRAASQHSSSASGAAVPACGKWEYCDWGGVSHVELHGKLPVPACKQL